MSTFTVAAAMTTAVIVAAATVTASRVDWVI
jgi:hypothetical protein